MSAAPAAPLRERIEAGFARFARVVVRHRLVCIALMLALAAALSAPLPRLTLDTAIETFLHEDDPARVRFIAFRDQFGRAEQIVVCVRPRDVFELEALRRLRALHEAIEAEVPHVDEVTSLVNARSTRGEVDELIVEDLMEEFPEDPAEAAALRQRVLSNPLYRNTLISEDGRFTSLVITLALHSDAAAEPDLAAGFEEPAAGDEAAEPPYLSADEIEESLSALRALMARHGGEDFELALAGSPVLTERITGTMQRDIPRFVGLMLVTVAALLLLLFRRLSAVLLPLLVVALSVLSTLGAMAGTGHPLSAPTQVLPTFLLAVGTGAAVHILKIFYLRFDAGDSREDALAYTLGHSGIAIVMTSLTTAGGLLSFRAVEIAPIADLGAFAPLGILLSLLNCLVLLPALLASVPLLRRARAAGAPGRLARAIVRTGVYSVSHPRLMVGVTLLLLAISVSGALRIRFSNDIMAWLPEDEPLRAATQRIDRELKGSITLEVVADTGRRDGVKDPAFLNGLDALRERTAALGRGDALFVGKTISIADVLKEIHQALHENRSEFYAVPQDRELVAQELLLFENSGTDDLEDVVDTGFSLARFTIKVPYTDPMDYDGFIEEVEAEFGAVLGEAAAVHTTGFMAMMGQTMHHVIYGMARSYVLALAIITPLMILLLGDLRAGLVSMVPNLAPILLTLGVMGWLGIAIDMFTMMIGGIAIGLAVDDTIHFAHGYRRYLARTGSPLRAARETLETTGQALLVTSIALSTGFLVFALSQMQNLMLFGLLTSFTIATAFVIDIAISPALLGLVTRAEAAPAGGVAPEALPPPALPHAARDGGRGPGR